MKIGVILASSQAGKNSYIFETVRRFAPGGSEVINFGCTLEESNKYSYVDISMLIGLLLESEAVDFVVTYILNTGNKAIKTVLKGML